jgi:uncharacterized protein (DUF2062 family)
MRGTWLHRKLGERLFAREMWQPERGRFALGCAIGVFFAMMPVPFQMVAAALFAFLVRVNLPAAVASTWVSNPLTTPLILFSQYKLGSFVLGRAVTEQPKEDMLALLAQAPWPLLVGALISGTTLSLGAYPLALAGWDWLSARVLQARKERS